MSLVQPAQQTCLQGSSIDIEIFIGTVKPEALSCAPVNAQRPTDGIAIPAGFHRLRKKAYRPLYAAICVLQ
jgi:hypothetical protein